MVTRSLSRQMHPITLQFHTGTFATLLCLPMLVFGQGAGFEFLELVRPTGINWLWLLGVGFFATLSHMIDDLCALFSAFVHACSTTVLGVTCGQHYWAT